MRPLLSLVFLLALTGCPEKPEDSDTDIGSDTDTTSDTDIDTDSDSDSDTDTDVDTNFAQCGPEIVATLPHTISGTNFLEDFPNDGDFSMGGEGGCAQAAGPEVAFQVSLVSGEILAVAVGGGELSGVIHIKEVCDTATECLASVDQDLDGRMEFTAPSTGDYIVIVESFNANPVDAYTISMGIVEAEVCDDGEDNDVDGLVDCADQIDCGSFPACIEVCDDGLDNDADGFIDCDDNNSCFGVGDCQHECLDDVVTVTLPYAIAGTDFSADFDDNAAYAGGEGCSFGGGHEHVMAVEMTAGTRYLITELDSADITLRVMNTCIEAESCLASQDNERLEFEAPANGTYFVVVEGWSGTPTGNPYNIQIAELAPEACDDGIDNDLDGFTDCEDLGDCFDTVECPFECPAVDIDAALASGGFSLSGAHFDDVAAPIGFYAEGDGCSTGSGQALVYEVSLTAGQGIRVAERSSSDVTWRVMDSCTPGDACLESTDTEAPPVPFYEATADETVFVVVQAYFTTEQDPFSFYLQLYQGDEVCDDGIDNDANGAIDCFDSACFDATTCAPTCDGVTSLPVELSGSDFFADFPEVADYASGTDCSAGVGADAVFQVDLLEADVLLIEELGGLDATIRVLEGCAGGETCLESVGSPERLEFTAPATGEYTIVVESAGQSPFNANYIIRMGIAEPEVCDDGLDNDLDGAVDCGDLDCYDPVTCIYECPGDVVTLPFNVAGTNFSADFPNDADYSTGEDCTFGAGHEAVFQVDMLGGESIQVAETGTADMTVRMLGGSCIAGDSCFVSQDGPENFTFQAPEDGLYTVVIEGWSTNPTTGSYDISIDILPPEDCTDGEDNDLDGAVDCFDSDCFDPVTCPVDCLAIDTTPLPYNVAGADISADYDNRFDFSDNVDCEQNGGGPEAFFDVTLIAGDTVRITQSGSLFDVIRVIDECAPDAACLADSGAGTLDFTAPADGVYTVVVEAAFDNPFSVAYDVDIQLLEPEDCSSTEDEDLDGLIGCADPDCYGEVGLCDEELECFDGIDEDADGDVDCDDSDCAAVLGCGAGSVILTQNFDTWPLVGWTIDDGGTISAGNYATFEECVAPGDADSCTNNLPDEGILGTSGSFAFIDSDDPGVGTTSDDAVVSPQFDLTGYTDAIVSFLSAYNDIGASDEATVEISTDGGTTWVEVASMEEDLAGSPVVVDLSDYAGQSGLTLRWHYVSGWDWWWALDDIRVEAL